MDPNQALGDARKAVAEYNQAADAEDGLGQAAAAEQLAWAFEALDDWLSQNGFLPTRWQVPLLVTLADGRQIHVRGTRVNERDKPSGAWGLPFEAGTEPHQPCTYWLGPYN